MKYNTPFHEQYQDTFCFTIYWAKISNANQIGIKRLTKIKDLYAKNPEVTFAEVMKFTPENNKYSSVAKEQVKRAKKRTLSGRRKTKAKGSVRSSTFSLATTKSQRIETPSSRKYQHTRLTRLILQCLQPPGTTLWN